METIELEDLINLYSDETVQDIVEHWQSDIFMHPMTCTEHPNVVLKYEKGILYCPEKECFYHQHYIPTIVLKFWEEVE